MRTISLLAALLALSSVAAAASTPCENGFAGVYPCSNIDLLAVVSLGTMGTSEGNDVWGWTDLVDGSEYAIMGLFNGSAFVDLTDPENPVYLGTLPTQTQNSSWRDMKVYQDHAFIVSEADGHGMQVFDLAQLRNVASPPAAFVATAHYDAFGFAHNIAINEESGFAYVVGTNTCAGGLHMVDIQDPLQPTFAGCVDEDGYIHDTQCVIYQGPDAGRFGREICINSNEDTITIVDVTEKSSPVQLSRTSYPGVGYTHQGWLTDDHRYFLLGDEDDEGRFGHNSRTRVWDLADLAAPDLVGFYSGETRAADHNLYIHGGLVYEANYRAGLRILQPLDLATASLTEVGFFDIFPASDSSSLNGGAWSVYPFFSSGVVVVSGTDSGLFVLRPSLCGNGMVDPGEQCDDGNLVDGDGCSSACESAVCGNGTVEPGEQCDDGNLVDGDGCSACENDTTCPETPSSSCRGAQKSLLVLKDSQNDASDKLTWKLSKADATTASEFGDPTSSTTTLLCIYTGDAPNLVGEVVIEPSSTKWSPIGSKGYKFKDQTGTSGGVQKIVLKGSEQDKTLVLVKGKGAGLPDLAPPLVAPVSVQLRNTDTGICWGSTYETGDFGKNEAGKFKAKTVF